MTEDTKKQIEPSLPSGFRDYLPQDMIPRTRMLDTIRASFERFGFSPLDTPGIEKEEILTGGDPAFRMNIFRAGIEGSKEDLALRFDLTVPLARVVSQYRNEISKPFKRYQMGKVWRGERPQAGRFREFMQCDADIVGAKSLVADAEIVALMYETMAALGFSAFRIRMNNRKILNGLASYAGYPREKSAAVLRAIDKMDKIGWDGVAAELGRGDEKEAGVGLNEDAIAAIEKFINIGAGSPWDILKTAEDLMKNSPEAQEGIAELREIASYLQTMRVPDDVWTVDLSVARGLGYYTGPVFETILTDLPSIGSVFSGGRYDGLVERFGDQNVPAVGASVGIDRLFAAMEKMGLVEQGIGIAKAVVLDFDPSCRGSVLRVASDIRRAGVPCDIYLGSDTSIKGQLSYALSRGAHFVVIIGASENDRGVVQLKDLLSRSQEEIPQDDIGSALSSRCAAGGHPAVV